MDSPPPLRRVLKRSASTASLLTPPRTYRRRARGRSRGSCDSDSDNERVGSDHALSSDDEETRDTHRKKRKLDTKSAADDGDEEAKFWGGDGEASKPEDASKKASTSRPTKPLLYQRFKTQSSGSTVASEKGLVSPPPSHRKTNAPPIPTSPSPATTVSLPVTPKPKSKRRDKALDSDVPALIDSPSNPFAATPAGEADEVESPPSLAQVDQAPTTPVYDKPTVTYVFRGVRRVYQNPAFNHAQNRPLTPPPNSKLPVEDPNFSPDPTCKPRLLFPEAHKKRKGKKTAIPTQSGSKRARNATDSETEGVKQTRSRGRVVKQPKLKRTLTLEDELQQAAAKTQTNEDDPFR